MLKKPELLSSVQLVQLLSRVWLFFFSQRRVFIGKIDLGDRGTACPLV